MLSLFFLPKSKTNLELIINLTGLAKMKHTFFDNQWEHNTNNYLINNLFHLRGTGRQQEKQINSFLF